MDFLDLVHWACDQCLLPRDAPIPQNLLEFQLEKQEAKDKQLEEEEPS